MRWLIGLAVAGLPIGAPALAQGEIEGFVRAAQVQVPPTGREVAIPVPQGTAGSDLRVVLGGSFACSYNGRSYDAADGYIRWSPEQMRIAERDARQHRYVLRPSTEGAAPESVSAWVDVDRLVRELIVTPSEVRESLSGDVRLELWVAKRAGSVLAIILPVAAAVLVIGGLAAVSTRRAQQSMADVDDLLRRIERKYATATGSARERDWDTAEFEDKLAELRGSAEHLAGQIATFRRTARTVDRDQLEQEIADAQRRLAAAEREDLRAELQSVIEAKRRLRDLLEDSAATQQRCLLRLSRIESALDTAVVQIAEQDGRMADRGADRDAIEGLERELRATDETIEELKFLEDPEAPAPGE